MKNLHIYHVKKWSFSGINIFSLRAAGLFSRSLLGDTQGARLYTTVQVWAPTGLRLSLIHI